MTARFFLSVQSSIRYLYGLIDNTLELRLSYKITPVGPLSGSGRACYPFMYN